MNSRYVDFLFFEDEEDSKRHAATKSATRAGSFRLERSALAPLALATLPTAASLMASASLSSAVVAACIPIIIPISAPLTFDSESVALTEEAKLYVKGLLFASATQASLAFFDVMLGDFTRALIKGMFAGLGWYVTRPEGLNSLSSFTMVSFLSGSINGIAALQLMIAAKGPLFSGLLPLVVNYIRFSDLVHPALCLGSAYLAWMLLKEIRRVNAVITDRSQTTAVDGTAELTGGTSLRRRLPGATAATEFRPFQGTGHSLSASAQVAASLAPQNTPA